MTEKIAGLTEKQSAWMIPHRCGAIIMTEGQFDRIAPSLGFAGSSPAFPTSSVRANAVLLQGKPPVSAQVRMTRGTPLIGGDKKVTHTIIYK